MWPSRPTRSPRHVEGCDTDAVSGARCTDKDPVAQPRQRHTFRPNGRTLSFWRSARRSDRPKRRTPALRASVSDRPKQPRTKRLRCRRTDARNATVGSDDKATIRRGHPGGDHARVRSRRTPVNLVASARLCPRPRTFRSPRPGWNHRPVESSSRDQAVKTPVTRSPLDRGGLRARHRGGRWSGRRRSRARACFPA